MCDFKMKYSLLVALIDYKAPTVRTKIIDCCNSLRPTGSEQYNVAIVGVNGLVGNSGIYETSGITGRRKR